MKMSYDINPQGADVSVCTLCVQYSEVKKELEK